MKEKRKAKLWLALLAVALSLTAITYATAADELELIETLNYDSAEHFFVAQMQGNATRFLGARFRTDDGSNKRGTITRTLWLPTVEQN